MKYISSGSNLRQAIARIAGGLSFGAVEGPASFGTGGSWETEGKHQNYSMWEGGGSRALSLLSATSTKWQPT